LALGLWFLVLVFGYFLTSSEAFSKTKDQRPKTKSTIFNRQSTMSRGVHRFAVLVACATFFLIIAGANVTSHDAGLATTEGLLSKSQYLPKMVGNLF